MTTTRSRHALLALAFSGFGCAAGAPVDPGLTNTDASVPAPFVGDGEDLAVAKPDLARVFDLAGADLTPPATCDPATCNTGHESCVGNACKCDPGFARDQNPQLSPGTDGLCEVDTSSHAQADVCARYKASAVVPANSFSKSATSCDPGALSQAGMDSALSRVNFYRWLVGVPEVTVDATQNAQAQKCALVSASNAPASTVHNPPSTSTCYTSDGATSAGKSDIAWNPGNFPAAVDLWVADTGNPANVGNRRALFGSAFDPVGIGMYTGGVNGGAACLQLKTLMGTGPSADFIAYPPPGYAPLAVVKQLWSFTWPGFSNTSSIAVTVVRQSDMMTMPVTVALLTSGPWPDAFSIAPNGWTPASGQTYRVTVTYAMQSLKWTYDVKPVDCP